VSVLDALYNVRETDLYTHMHGAGGERRRVAASDILLFSYKVRAEAVYTYGCGFRARARVSRSAPLQQRVEDFLDEEDGLLNKASTYVTATLVFA
jgi:hypothetical protein